MTAMANSSTVRRRSKKPEGKDLKGKVLEGKIFRSKSENAGAETRGAKTRARILATCQQLFNERGPANVTTADIADAVGINEGNLYYHFQRKEQLVESLFDAFEHSLQEVAAAHLTYGDDASRYADYLAGWFNLMWEWRFFYRDCVAVYQLAPPLRARTKALSDYGQDHIRRAMKGMIRAGLIRVTADEIETLIVNSWIIATYWIDYLRGRHGLIRITREHIAWGAAQTSSLFAPYFTPLGSQVMNRSIASASSL
jgi:AcrR family transcriptional regulator